MSGIRSQRESLFSKVVGALLAGTLASWKCDPGVIDPLRILNER